MEFVLGVLIYFFVRCILFGFYTVDQNERAVKTSFGRADRIGEQRTSSLPMAETLSDEERPRYNFPLVRHPAHRIPERLQEHIATAIDAVVLGPDREHNVLAPHVGRHLDCLAPVVPQGQRGAGVGDADAELTCMRAERVAAEEHHLGVAARGVPGGRHPLVILKGRLKTGIGKQVAALRAGGRGQRKDADQRRETAPGQTRDGAKTRHGYPRYGRDRGSPQSAEVKVSGLEVGRVKMRTHEGARFTPCCTDPERMAGVQDSWRSRCWVNSPSVTCA